MLQKITLNTYVVVVQHRPVFTTDHLVSFLKDLANDDKSANFCIG